MPISLWKKRQILSLRGEKLAERFLKKSGYSIIARRFWTRFGELDLIAKKGSRLAFVEVKTRRGPGPSDPLEAITYSKWKRLRRASVIYMQKYPEERKDLQMEFLGIGVRMEGKKTLLSCVNLFSD